MTHELPNLEQLVSSYSSDIDKAIFMSEDELPITTGSIAPITLIVQPCTAWSKRDPAKFGEGSSVMADWLCLN